MTEVLGSVPGRDTLILGSHLHCASGAQGVKVYKGWGGNGQSIITTIFDDIFRTWLKSNATHWATSVALLKVVDN